MTREEFIKVNIELAIDFWELNLTDRTFEIKFKELLDEYESSKEDINNEDTKIPFKATKEGKLYIETSDFFKLKSVTDTINKLIESSIYKNINKQCKEEKYKELSENEITKEHIQRLLTDRSYNTDTFKDTFNEVKKTHEYLKLILDKTKPNFGGNDKPSQDPFINIKQNNNLSDLQKMDIAEAVDIEMKKFKEQLLEKINEWRKLDQVELEKANVSTDHTYSVLLAGRDSGYLKMKAYLILGDLKKM